MKTALVFGYYGKDNQGDDAMLQVIQKQFRKLNIKTIALSYNPAKTRKQFCVEAVSHKADLEKLDYDFFVLGGGTQVQDYRLKGFENLVKFFLRAKKPGVKACLLSIGATKLKTRRGKELARKLCENSDLVIMRDRESKRVLEKAGVKARIHVSADLTFAESKKPIRKKRNAILFCPIAYHAIYELAPKKDFRLAEKLARAIDLVAEGTGARIELLPFFKRFDVPMCRSIMTQVKSRRVKMQKFRPLGIGLAREFEKFDLVVGMRFHSLVFSAFLGRPFVAVAFTAKTKNLVSSLAWKRFSVSKGFRPEGLAEKAIRLYGSIPKERKKLLAKRKPLEKKSRLAFRLFKQRLL